MECESIEGPKYVWPHLEVENVSDPRLWKEGVITFYVHGTVELLQARSDGRPFENHMPQMEGGGPSDRYALGTMLMTCSIFPLSRSFNPFDVSVERFYVPIRLLLFR